MLAAEILDKLPPDFPDAGLEVRVREAVAALGHKVVALDDDPTGVQTVHDIPVLAEWSVSDLETELKGDAPAFFILTNSRSLPATEAIALNREIAGNLTLASERTGVSFVVASRSDSTLRGHFPDETDALAMQLGGIDGVVICPAFFEGGRVTIGDVHYLRDGDRLVPAGETEFARDATFGYRNSNLRGWVEEKTGGRIAACDVASLTIEEIRIGGPDRVSERLMQVTGGQPVVVNAATYTDLHVATLGIVAAESRGKRFVYRTGASFVRARAGISARVLLSREELVGLSAPPRLPGLVVVGSHVKRTGEQLDALLTLPGIAPIEVAVPELLGNSFAAQMQIRDATNAALAALSIGMTPVIFTSRTVELDEGGDQLRVSQAVSAALVEIVGSIDRRPGFIVGKGGITSSDIGTKALRARRALVLGQIRPGVPVWRLGPESRFPDLPYIVFPGNVGGPETLAEIVRELQGDRIT